MLALCAGALALATACASGHEPSGRYVQLRGIRLYVAQYGRGPALLLLHGGTGNGDQFQKQLTAFSPHYRCIVPDMCAQGRTSDRPGPLSYHAMAEDAVALLDRLHVRRASIMGWSDGGIVGLDIAIQHPDRVDHLVTFGANFTPDGLNAQDVEWNRTATPASFGPQAPQEYAKLAPDPAHFSSAMAKIIDMWRTQPEFSLGQLRSIRAKTMICAGEHDLIRPEHTEMLARSIPGATLWIVPGASHGAMLEKPELVNARVLEFLRK